MKAMKDVSCITDWCQTLDCTPNSFSTAQRYFMFSQKHQSYNLTTILPCLVTPTLCLKRTTQHFITWRWLHDIQLHGKVIFRAQMSSRPMGVFKLHNPKLFFFNSACVQQSSSVPSHQGHREQKTKPNGWMECVEDHWLDNYWGNEWRRLLLPFQNWAKFKRNSLLRNPDSDQLYLMDKQYTAELIQTALIPARKIDVAWHYQFVSQRICSDQ